LAGPLLMWVLALTAVSGCFWPQDDQLFTEIPRKKNSPPRIVLDQVKPGGVDVSLKPSSCPNPFSIIVEDPDIADPIYNRWFVYAPGAKPVAYFDGEKLTSSTKPVRDKAIIPPAQWLNISSELMQNGEHRLEVVIADGLIRGSSATDVEPHSYPLADGGTVDDSSYIDSYVWVVKTSDSLPDCTSP
jgi:hypothetical protein